MMRFRRPLICAKPLFAAALLVLASTAQPVRAQFLDTFDGKETTGWFTMTGDGDASMTFESHDGFARIRVDATKDRQNVWWAIIKRDVAGFLDLARLADPAYELRVEARVRPSHAPRRVNIMLNTQRTTDFHEHLREYELASTSDWQTISMTTRNFDARPGDAVFIQLGVTDWGPGEYFVDLDYYRADVVRRDEAASDLGEPLVYHPPVPNLATFRHHLPVTHDSLIHGDFRTVNFDDWHVLTAQGVERVLTLTANQWAVLRWDFGSLAGRQAEGAAVLELTTQAIAHGGDYVRAFGEDLGIEFGKVRVIEILGGNPDWDQTTVTYTNLLSGKSEEGVFNSQMTFDVELVPTPDGRSHVTLPRPVVQRLLDGRTRGLLLRPLGAIVPSLYASEDPAGRGPSLYLNTQR